MATIARGPVEQLGGETRLLLRNIRWETYEALAEDLAEEHIHLTYDEGSLELMSPSDPHEWFKKCLARLIEMMTFQLDIPIRSGGSTTFRKRARMKGLEPDECYWIRNEPRVRGKRVVDLAIDPPPDLAIEIEITTSMLNRRGIYAALGVPEIWRYDGESLQVLQLQADGTYAPCDRSMNLPFLAPDEVCRFLGQLGTMDETSWLRSFHDWVRAEIAPHFPGQAGGAEPP